MFQHTLSRRAALLVVALLAPLGLAPVEQDAAAPAQDMAQRAAEPVVVFCVRHAEKGDDDARDPGLSAAGDARARELARVLAGAGVTHLFASEYRRTQRTLLPLGEAVGAEVEVVGARDAGALAERILALEPGSVAVVAGHSNTTPTIVKMLARAEVTPSGRDLTATLGEDEYGLLFEVVLPPPGQRTGEGATLPKLLELRYGDA